MSMIPPSKSLLLEGVLRSGTRHAHRFLCCVPDVADQRTAVASLSKILASPVLRCPRPGGQNLRPPACRLPTRPWLRQAPALLARPPLPHAVFRRAVHAGRTGREWRDATPPTAQTRGLFSLSALGLYVLAQRLEPPR